MLNYFSAIYAADAKLQKKESGNGLLKKSHPKFAHRMWGGDDNSPFHVTQLHQHTVDFTKTSSDYGSHSLRRSKKPEVNNDGGSGRGGGSRKPNIYNNVTESTRENVRVKKMAKGIIE